MSSPAPSRKTIVIKINENLFYRMMELHVSPTVVANAAFKAEVRRIERKQALEEREKGLQAVQRIDPRVTNLQLKSSSTRVRRLRRMASVYEPSIGV